MTQLRENIASISLLLNTEILNAFESLYVEHTYPCPE